MFTNEFLPLLLTALGSGTFLAAILETYRWWKDRQIRLQDPFKEVLPKIHQIYSIVEELRRDIGAKRVTILKTENGGGLPKIDSHIYSSILYETAADSEYKVKSEWQKQKVDKPYIEMLMRVYQLGELQICTEDLTPSILKDVYTAYGTGCSIVCSVSTAYNKFMYLSVHFGAEHEMDSLAETKIRAAVNKLSYIFNTNKLM